MNLLKHVLLATGLVSTIGFSSVTCSKDENNFNNLNNLNNEDNESHIQKRIVGGVNVLPPNKYSFLFRMTGSRSFRCAGSLIDPYWILTAGHCVMGVFTEQILFESHRYNISVVAEDEGAKVHQLEFISLHPNYGQNPDPKGAYVTHDIALARLKSPIYDIPPINLERTQVHSTTGTPLVVSGWGSIFENGPISYILQEVTVPVVDNNLCKQAYPGIDTENTNICAGYDGGALDACNGDSGGPLFIKDPIDDEFYQVGIVSSGRGCARPFSYGTYSRVSSLTGFIDQTISTYTNPCANNPCSNGGLCSGFDRTGGLGKRYQCLCPIGFDGESCEISTCGPSCSLASSGVLNQLIQRYQTKTFEITATNFPTSFSSIHDLRIVTEVIDKYGDFEAIVTAPNGKEIILEFFDTYIVNSQYNCFTYTSWQFDAPNNITNCPATLLRPRDYVDFTGDDLNGKWTITISNYFLQNINLFSWGVEVTTIQTCSNNVCQNGGTCIEKFGATSCLCPFGALGDFCEYTPCSPNPCAHGACSIDGLSPICDCDPGFAGRYCDRLSCPQGCLFGQCQPGGKCLCSLGWTGPSCSTPDVGNTGEALCFSNNEQVYDGEPVTPGIDPIGTAVTVSNSRNCAIETSSGGKNIIDVGYVVNDGFNDYCCRGKSKVGITSPSSSLTCITRDCEGTPLQAGLGSASFAINPAAMGSDCYHSCIDATLSASTCASSPLFKGSLITVNNKKRAPGDSLYIATQPSSRKDCIINSGTTVSSGFTIQLDDGSRYCCGKGIYDSEQEVCTSGCLSSPLQGRPFVMKNSMSGDACYASCYSIQ